MNSTATAEQRSVRVGIDARSLSHGASGVATYVRNLLERIEWLEPLRSGFPSNNFLWNHLRVIPAQWRRRWRLYHAPSYTSPLVGLCPTVLTVHDVSYLVSREWYPYHLDGWRLRFYSESLKRADRVIVSSDFSGDELLRILPGCRDRLRRVYLGVSDDFFRDDEAARDVRRSLDLPEEYLLHVGDIHPRRNVSLISEVGERLDLPVVLVGRVLQGEESFRDWPLRFSGLSQRDLRGVYSGAKALVYPSLYEGFGFPLLEAMACEVPVVSVRRSCIPEVCGEAAVLVEPEVGQLTRAVLEAFERKDELVSLGLDRCRLFNWERTAAETRRVYEELLD